MENDTEVIRQQMEGTRQALSEKVEAVEELVASAVKETTQSVAKTVENVTNTVESTVNTVADSVESVKNTVADSVESVKEAFNVSACVDKYPWASMAGSVALGYTLGCMLPSANGQHTASSYGGAPAVPPSTAYSGVTAPAHSETSGPQSDKSTLGSFLPQSWMPIVEKLKGLAIGTTAGMIGEMVMNMVPENLKSEVENLIDETTRNLGGHVVRKQH